VRLELRNLGILNGLKAPSVEVILLEAAAQFLKGTAGNAEDGQRCGDGVIVAKVNLGVEVRLILLRRGLLVESARGLACTTESLPWPLTL
jgi:hypothetical protein